MHRDLPNGQSLWPHQEEGVSFALQRPATYLAWGMGSGKTLAGVRVAMEHDVVVVLCPQSVGPSWARHFAKADPGRAVVAAWEGDGRSRAQAIVEARGRVAVVVNYDSSWRPAVSSAIESLPLARGCIIADEAHRLKSPGSKQSRWAHRLARKFPDARRLCLSGTPLPHTPLDAYGQFRFLDESVFGTSYAAFRSRFAIPHPKFPQSSIGFQNQDVLAAKMAALTHSVSTDAVMSLPAEQHTTIEVPLGPAASKFYAALAKTFCAELDSGETVTAANALVKLLRLQQACSGHTAIRHDDGSVEKFLLDPGDVTAKGEALGDWLSDVPEHEPVVVFCKFAEDLRQTRLAAKRAGRNCLELSGAVRGTAELDAWQRASGGEVLAVQIQSGGAGVDLSRSSIVAYLSLGHSLGEFEQSVARTRRYGQRAARCLYYHFVATLPWQRSSVRRPSSADELVYDALRDKKQVIECVYDLVRAANPEGSRHAITRH
jgi:SNF2 family DNA or RNA helicase